MINRDTKRMISAIVLICMALIITSCDGIFDGVYVCFNFFWKCIGTFLGSKKVFVLLSFLWTRSSHNSFRCELLYKDLRKTKYLIAAVATFVIAVACIIAFVVFE